MCLEIIAIILSVFTILAVLTGGGVMLWLLNKPKVHLLSATGIWHFSHRNGEAIEKTTVFIIAVLQNRGVETTSITGTLETRIANVGIRIYHSEDIIALSGNCAQSKQNMTLELPISEGCPAEGEIIQGILKLEPIGNRRLFCGSKFVSVAIDIPYSKYPAIDKTISR